MNLSPYELVFGRKPKRPIMFNLSSTTDGFGNCKPSPSHPVINSPNFHTLTISVIVHKIKKLQKRTFAHWFLNREKIHLEIYNEVHNYLHHNKQIRTFINRRFGTTQTLKNITHVLIINKVTQIGISKKIQPQKIGPY